MKKSNNYRTVFALAKNKLGVSSDQVLAEEMNYESASSLTRIKNGDTKFPPDKQAKLAELLNITVDQIELEPRKLGEILQLQEHVVDAILRKHAPANKIKPEDLKTLDQVRGTYLQLYLNTGIDDSSILFMTAEKVVIEKRRQGESSSLIKQIDNEATGSNPKGRITCKSKRLTCSLVYNDQYYPDSMLYLKPIRQKMGFNILDGIYTDITMSESNPIFATRTVLVQVADFSNYEGYYSEASEGYKLWKDIISNDASTYNRLMVSSGQKHQTKIRDAATKFRKLHGEPRIAPREY